MKRLILGIVLGVTATLAGTAAAHQFSARAPVCHTQGIEAVCSLPHLPSNSITSYIINVRDVDLSCMFSHYSGSPEGVGCNRLSKPETKCVDDTFGSLSAFITLGKVEVDTPQHCLPKPGGGSKFTSGYTRHVFYRSP